MRQQSAIQQPPCSLDLALIQQPVGGKKAAARIGQRPRYIGAPGQQPPAFGTKEGFEFSGKLAQSPFSIVRCRPARLASNQPR